ncbi:MAG: extracellular solute-binding protein [Oliverpabstia sp.]|nr:extracellular solute-binding protein [Oliverpabstia sp.]
MNTRKILWSSVLVASVMLVMLYLGFRSSSEVEEISLDNKEVIRILAPYESKLHQNILKQIAKEYSRGEDRPEFVFEFVPKEKLKKELSMRSLAGKEEVDIVICSNTLMPELIEMDMLKEISVPSELIRRVRKSQMWSSTRKDGKYYGIPFTCDPYVLFYREDVFEENQLEVPQTWEELMECGKTIQKMGVKSIGIAGKRETETANVYQLMLYSMGGNFRSISQDTGVEAFDYFWKVARSGMLSKEMMNYTQEDLAREFADGKISIMINQMSTASILRTNRISFSVGMDRIPDDAVGSVFLYGDNIGLTKDANPAAWDFVMYLMEADVSERICSSMDTLPVLEGVEYQKNKKIYLKDPEDLLENARLLETYSGWTQMSESIASGVYKAVENNQVSTRMIALEVHDLVRTAIVSG